MSKTDTIHLIDRYEASPYRGTQVLEFAVLHRAPRSALDNNEITGALAHGDSVLVEQEIDSDGNAWAKVFAVATDPKTGKSYKQTGYIKVTLLKDLGAVEMEKINA